jgi:hypothetical protein
MTSNDDMDIMKLKLVPQSEVSKTSTEFFLVDTTNFEQVPTTVTVAWDGRYGATDEIPFELTFFDENRNLLKDVRYTYILTKGDDLIEVNSGDDPNSQGILASEGIDIPKIYVPSEGQYQLDIHVHGLGLDYDPTYAGIGSAIIEIGPSLPRDTIISTPDVKPPTAIPEWIKNNAAWWADGQIDDNSFVQGIQYLIKEGIMNIPPTTQGSSSGGNEIPEWIKNNAAWWADGQIDDNSFVQGLQFLIKEGIMKVES